MTKARIIDQLTFLKMDALESPNYMDLVESIDYLISVLDFRNPLFLVGRVFSVVTVQELKGMIIESPDLEMYYFNGLGLEFQQLN